MKWLKVSGVVFGAVLITALGIDAADTLQGSRSTLLGQIISTESGGCPSGMIAVSVGQTFSCVDVYEASASSECSHTSPSNAIQTTENIAGTKCASESKEDALPWRNITREQAQTACLRAGKRLPTASEWNLVSAGTPDTAEACNIDSNGVDASGSHESCTSAIGVFDAIGNVWEWTSDDIIQGQYNGRSLPESGYVAQVDSDGIATVTKDESSDIFFEDYFWSDSEGAYGMIRGGFYGSRSDAGVYTVHADTLPTSAGTAIGFRCVL